MKYRNTYKAFTSSIRAAKKAVFTTDIRITFRHIHLLSPVLRALGGLVVIFVPVLRNDGHRRVPVAGLLLVFAILTEEGQLKQTSARADIQTARGGVP
jgi:hypothetical protein